MSTTKTAIAWSFYLMRRFWVPVSIVSTLLVLSFLDHEVFGIYFNSTNRGASSRFIDLVRLNEARVMRGSGNTVTTDDSPLYFQTRTAPCTGDNPCSLLAIADLDQQSRVDDGKKYKSLLADGQMYASSDGTWYMDWSVPQEIYSPINEGNRGMELSELILFNERLYSVDDRTGLVVEIIRDKTGNYDVIPRHILTEGDGVSSAKGMKLEWGTVKDNVMWLGSFGKEYTLPDGSIKNQWPLWVAAMDTNGNIKRKNWTQIYTYLREVTNAPYPGYMIHEAVEWSPINRKWYILPRRWSNEAYDAEKDNEMGTNKLIECNESFLDCQVTEIGHTHVMENPRRGYSSVKIIPSTNDKILVALRTEEEDAIANEGTMQTYLQILNTDGDILMEDTKLPFEGKFEGIVIADKF